MKPATVVLGLLVSVVAIVALREATMSRHVPVAADTAMEVVVEASSNDPALELADLVAALVAVCELEVTTDPLGPPTPLGGRTYRFLLQPALDETDQRQLDGCLEDAKLDHLQVKVLAMRAVAAPLTPREAQG